MKKINLFLLPILIILAIGGSWFALRSQPTPKATVNQTKLKPKPSYRPLTKAELNHNSKLTDCSIVYYAIKHSKIQRWQEVSNFDLGWQLDQYPIDNGIKVLVWPDMAIKKDSQLVQPNWFYLSATGQVIYHSFIVHSFRDDMTETTDLETIIKTLNNEHAAKKIRQMLPNTLIVKHKNPASN